MVSAGVHAAVVAWLAIRSHARPATEPPAVTTIEIITVDPVHPVDRPVAPPEADAPIDLVLRDEPAAVPPAPTRPAMPAPPRTPAPGRATPPRAADTAAITTGPTGPTEAPGAPAGPRPDRPSLLAMRHGEAPRIALSFGHWDVDHPPRGSDAVHDPVSGQLHATGGGSYRSEQGGFDATVRPDGTVELHDNPAFSVHFAVPSLGDLGRGLADWYTSDKGASGKEGDTGMSRQIQLSPGATVAPSDPIGVAPQDHARTVIVPVLAGGFEVTDWLMRRHGQDPYAARKRALLDATRDERVAIGNRHRSAELARAPEMVHRQLEALWAGTTDLAERKQGLFELWDDCVETGDDELVAAADAARRMIVGFIRAHLAAGSAEAYTPAELTALARTQRSKAAFAPYD
ncbi:MAG TPA: hypothetical protein VHW23_12185 [Kofleriaceae bacterium]|nr:hypothetical protein [Kofleriaceae bacterium]